MATSELPEQAFKTVIATHLDAMYRTALRILGDHHEAEDAVQLALSKAWRHLDRFEPGTQMKSWLFKILTNTCLDLIRSPTRKAAKRAENDNDPDLTPAQNRTPDELASDGELQGFIERAISQLPDIQQAVVHLIIVEEFTYQEAAHALNLPVGTVRSRLNRARGTLMTRLADHREASPTEQNHLQTLNDRKLKLVRGGNA